MRTFFAGVVITLAVFATGDAGNAADQPVLLDHTLTGVHQLERTVTADFILHVENQGPASFREFTLVLMRVPPLLGESTTVNVGDLGPHEKKDVYVQVATPIRLDRETLSRTTLLWKGSYLDGEGKTVHFSARTRPGGAK